MAADSQKMGSRVASGGQRIDNHAWWAGPSPRGLVFPDGAKTRNETSAEGAGSVMKYEDTTQAIRSTQVEGERQIKARPLKTGYRY